MLNKWLFTRIDNSALVVFRILFGFLITVEAWGAIFTGWIQRTLIEPQETFNFIGLEFLQPLPRYGMLYYLSFMHIRRFRRPLMYTSILSHDRLRKQATTIS